MVRKKESFQDPKKGTTPKFLSSEMILSSILTLLKINLSYLELFYDTIYQVLLVLLL